jgi:ribonuclease Z
MYAPEGLEEIMNTLFRLTGTHISYTINYHSLINENASLISSDSETDVYSFPVRHRVPCYGFLFKEKKPPRKILKTAIKGIDLPHSAFETLKRGFDFKSKEGVIYKVEEYTEPNTNPTSYLYVTDTSFKPELAESLQGQVHLLYHEATYANDMGDKATERYHSTAGQAAEFAAIVNADKLLIGHFSSRYHDLSLLLKQARDIFPESYLAEEGKSFTSL